MTLKKVGILTAGGLAPCLSAAVGGFIERYTQIAPDIEIICYRDGYKGLLLGDQVHVTPTIRRRAGVLRALGGSPIGNSRVKLTNARDCLKRGLIKDGEDPQARAAQQLLRDGVDVLHTVGGDDTNTAAADLAAFLKRSGHQLTVIGLPKTVDNDVAPIRQTLGAWTAAEQSARFFTHVVAEHSANPRMLVVHEVMGRNCGWLTAAAAHAYAEMLRHQELLADIGLSENARRVHAVFVPEAKIDLRAEAERLRRIMDEADCVNIFLSEGAGVESIVAEMEARGEAVVRDAFGHVKLDTINPGQWFGRQFAAMLGAEKTLVQKSGYFARSAPANAADLYLINSCVDLAVECALRGEAGVIGNDEQHAGRLRAIEFERIKGGKPFDLASPWFAGLLRDMGQPPAQPTAGT